MALAVLGMVACSIATSEFGLYRPLGQGSRCRVGFAVDIGCGLDTLLGMVAYGIATSQCVFVATPVSALAALNIGCCVT